MWKSYFVLAFNLIVWLSIEFKFVNHLPSECCLLPLPKPSVFLLLLLLLRNQIVMTFLKIKIFFSKSFWKLLFLMLWNFTIICLVVSIFSSLSCAIFQSGNLSPSIWGNFLKFLKILFLYSLSFNVGICRWIL